MISFAVFTTRNMRPFLYFFTSVIEMTYFLSFHSLSDELVTFLPLILEVGHLPIFAKDFPQ